MSILVVEDEALVALQIETFLETAGYAVMGVADSISTALDIVAHRKPELALVDVNLVGGDSGIELARRLREHDVPVLLATGNCPPALSRDVAVGCLGKPFHAQELIAAVEVALQAANGQPIGVPPPSLSLF